MVPAVEGQNQIAESRQLLKSESTTTSVPGRALLRMIQ
jgi:hypothetical protein